MARLRAVLIAAAALTGANISDAWAQYFPPWDLPPNRIGIGQFPPLQRSSHHDNGRAWRHYPPHYGAEKGPVVIAIAAEGFATNPCFNGGCHFNYADAGYAAHWGPIDPEPGAHTAAFQAFSRVAEKAAVSSVMIEPGASKPSRKRHRAAP